MCSLLSKAIINSAYSVKLWDYKLLLNWEKCERELSWTNFRHCSSICVIVSRKTTKNGIRTVSARARHGIRFRFPTGARNFYLPYNTHGAHPAFSPTGIEGPFPRIKRLGREPDHWPPCSTGKCVCSCVSTPPYTLIAWCLIKHRTNFTYHLSLSLLPPILPGLFLCYLLKPVFLFVSLQV
jgi:hypothetical protein